MRDERPPEVGRTGGVDEAGEPDRGTSCKERAKSDEGTEQRGRVPARPGYARPGGRRDSGRTAMSGSTGEAVPRAFAPPYDASTSPAPCRKRSPQPPSHWRRLPGEPATGEGCNPEWQRAFGLNGSKAWARGGRGATAPSACWGPYGGLGMWKAMTFLRLAKQAVLLTTLAALAPTAKGRGYKRDLEQRDAKW